MKAVSNIFHLSAEEDVRGGCGPVDMSVFETPPRLIRCHGCKIGSRLNWLARLAAVHVVWVRTGKGPKLVGPSCRLKVSPLPDWAGEGGRRCQKHYLCFSKVACASWSFSA